MKTRAQVLSIVAALCLGLVNLVAADKHDHPHKPTPQGGRLLDKTDPHAEFVIEKDRSVTIHFYSEDMKAIPATTQSVVVVADAKNGKLKLEFEKKGEVLASKGKLPQGDGYNLVVQFKQTPEAKPINLRFKLDLSICGECKRAEYACICDH